MFAKSLRFVLLLSVTVLLSGCIGVIPQEVTQTMSVQKDGSVEVVYEGEFADLDELLKLMQKMTPEDKTLSEVDVEEETVKTVKKTPHFVSIKRVKPHLFYIKFKDNVKLPNDYPKMFKGTRDAASVLFDIRNVSEISQNVYEVRNLVKEQSKDAKKDEADMKELNDFVNGVEKRFVGHVKIIIDGDLVLDSNAQSVKDMGGGKKLYEWTLKMNDEGKDIKFVFGFDKRDKPIYKLMSAPKGSSCKELISEDCKCGPFVLVTQAGEKMANTAYEITSPLGKHTGCTDKDGNTDHIISPVTGECTLRLDYGSVCQQNKTK